MDVNEAFLLPQKMSLIITATTSNWRFIFLFFFLGNDLPAKMALFPDLQDSPPFGSRRHLKQWTKRREGSHPAAKKRGSLHISSFFYLLLLGFTIFGRRDDLSCVLYCTVQYSTVCVCVNVVGV